MNTLRRSACLLLVLVLFLGGYPPTTRASAPARIQSLPQPAAQNQPLLAPLADLESGIDCGCNKIGDFLNPASGKIPSAGATSPKGTYTLQVTGSSIVNFIITRVADSSIVLSFSGPSGDFGFSPDDNRFAYWYTDAGMVYIRLYNLEAPGGAQLSWNTSGAFSAVEVLFSPTGKYFFLAELISSNYTRLLILDAKSAVQRYTDQFNFSILPGEPSDNFGLARYGFSPDGKDRTFVYSYVSAANSINLKVISLKTGNSLLAQNVTSISGFWQFSQCGDRLGKIDQTSASYLQTSLFKTLDGSLVAGSSQTVGIAASVAMKTTLAYHQAVIGATTYTLGSNTAPAACPVVPTLDTFNLDSASIMGGTPLNGTVELNVPAPAGGTVISLASSKPGVAAVPSTVTVPAGSLTASFSVTTFEVSSPTDVIISATLGSVTIHETLHVLIKQPVLTAITPNKTTIKPSETLTITISLAANAPTGGVHVSISNDHSNLIQMPSEVIIPAGKSSASIKVYPVTVSDVTIVTLSASLNSVTKTAQVTLVPHPPKLAAFQIKPSVVKGGNDAMGVITLTKTVPAGMLVYVNLSTTHPEAVSMGNSMVLSGGDLSGIFWITTHGVSEAINVTVTASLEEITRTNSLQVQPANLSGFSFDPACGVVLKDTAAKASIAGYPINSQISLDGGAPPAGAVIHLESSNPDLIQVPPTVFLSADNKWAQESFPTRAVAQPTLVTLTASYRAVKLSMPITLTLVPTYTVTTLPFPPVAINDAGQIAGSSSILYNGVITDLNLLVGGNLDVIDMNKDGDILAFGTVGGVEGSYYIDKTLVSLIDKPWASQALYAKGMNDLNEVVGGVFVGDQVLGFRWKDGVTTTLPTTPDRGTTVALDINNHGVIVGYSQLGAERWIGDLLSPLGVNPYVSLYVTVMAVNDAGTVALEQDQAIYVWKDGVYTPLPMPKPDDHGLFFRALNEKDEVLISARYIDYWEKDYREPAIHNQYGTYMLNCVANLEDGTRISDATDLNDLGQIVGTMKIPGETELVGILLTPYEKPTQKGMQIFLPLILR